MAIATKPKPKAPHHKKRTAAHHRQTKHYVKSYWPYLPMVAVVAAGIFVNAFLTQPSRVLGIKSDLTQQALLDATNTDRLDGQRDALTLNPQLEQAAQAKAADMAAQDYWSHTSPSGKQPWNFITAAGYQYQSAGENLAYGFDSANTVMNAWMHSHDHKANILDRSFTQVGFGVVQAPNYLHEGPQTIVVALYAQPVAAAGSTVLSANTPHDAMPVSRLQLVAPAASGLLIGILGTLAVVTVLLRHVIAWRKLLMKGELFVVQHPTFDTILVSIAVATVILNHAAGFIR